MNSLNTSLISKPESEFSIECFQNYTAPEVLIQGFASMQNQSDVESIIRAQKNLLQRFEKTNEMLLNVNHLSSTRIKSASDDFKKNSKLLVDMKKDLEYIFKKIRTMKTKLQSKYPEAFEEAKRQKLSAEEAVEDDVDGRTDDGKLSDNDKSLKDDTNIDYQSLTDNEQKPIKTLQGQFQNQHSMENDSSDTS